MLTPRTLRYLVRVTCNRALPMIRGLFIAFGIATLASTMPASADVENAVVRRAISFSSDSDG